MSNASRIVDTESLNDSSVDDTVDQLDYRTGETVSLMPTGHLTNDTYNEIESELQDAQVQQAVDDLPEKFKGKSAKDIAEAYTNLEKELGRKGQEIGEMRKLYDSILQNTLSNQPKQDSPQEPEPTTDIFDDPEGTVHRLVQKELAPLKQQQELSKQEKFNQNLQQNYPDAESIVGSQEFADWVQSSRIRMEIYQKADNWDWDAANELLSTYKALHSKPEPQNTLDLPEMEKEVKLTPEQRAARDTELRAATTERGSTGETSKKVFRRIDLMNLLRDDPERYYSLEPEIRKAYSEGRVR